MIRTILFVLGCLIVSTSMAQDDLVRFKDNSQYRGTISEYKPAEYLKMMVGGEPLVIEGEQLERVEKVSIDHFNYLHQNRRFWKEIQVGIIGGKANDFSQTETYASINAVGGYQFSRYVGVGLGSGYQQLSRINLVPIYATFRGDFYDSRVTPMYYADLGYGIGILRDDFFFDEGSAKGGLLLGTGLGLKIKLRSVYLTTTLGYRFQHSEITREFSPFFFDTRLVPSGEQVFVEKRNYNRIEFKIGIGF